MPRFPLRSRKIGDWAWQEVNRANLDDNVEAAYQMALQMGVGEDASRGFFYRRVEAEALTRQRATKKDINDWLTLEWVPGEIQDINRLVPLILASCDEIAHRLEWTHGPKVLISILADDTDAPWLPGRFGVFLRKNPYNKICIPLRATFDPARLHSVIIHEYAHEIVEELSMNQAPRWVHEMVATTAEGYADRNAAVQFANGRLMWLDPTNLGIEYNHLWEGRSRGKPTHPYQQSAWIGQYLLTLGGEKKLAEMLKAFQSKTVFEEIWRGLISAQPTERAMKRTYGMGQKQIFKNALNWIKANVARA